MQPSEWDNCIGVYFSAHISILGHVQLISKTVCSRHPESQPLSCLHVETLILSYQNITKQETYTDGENNTHSVLAQQEFQVVIQWPFACL